MVKHTNNFGYVPNLEKQDYYGKTRCVLGIPCVEYPVEEIAASRSCIRTGKCCVYMEGLKSSHSHLIQVGPSHA